MKESESEDIMKIHRILEVPFGDERTPACLMTERKIKKTPSLRLVLDDIWSTRRSENEYW